MKSNIKNLEKEKRISQIELIKRTELAKGTIIKAEKEIEKCKVETLEKIALALGVEINDLFIK